MTATGHAHPDHGPHRGHEHLCGADWARRAREVVQDAGHHKGAAREALIELLSSQDCALSAQEIEEGLREEGLRDGAGARPVARASVYRALELLHDLGLVARIDVGDGVTRYEPADPASGEHHHHLLCASCGQLVPFDDEALEEAIGALSRRCGFELTAHDVTLRGNCAACAAR